MADDLSSGNEISRLVDALSICPSLKFGPNIFANGFDAIQRIHDDAKIRTLSLPTTRTRSPSGSVVPAGIVVVMTVRLNLNETKENCGYDLNEQI